MANFFDSETEEWLKRSWKLMVVMLIPVMVVTVVAAVAVGLAIRSGAISKPDATLLFRAAAIFMLAGIFFSATLIRVGALRTGLDVPIVRALIPPAAFATGLLFSGVQMKPSFFATAAQVIPVLVLALAIEGRAFALNGLPGDHWLVRELLKISALSTMLVLTGGEAFALAGTSQVAPSPLHTGIVAGALASGFAGVMTYGLLGRFQATPLAGAPQPGQDLERIPASAADD